MGLPKLTFFCELDAEPLKELLNKPMLRRLQALHASLSLGIRDMKPERVEVVKSLNRAGIPVIAWLLLPVEEGYWFNLRNAPQAVRQYAEFRDWTLTNGLEWAGIGLDIEPDIRETPDLMKRNWRNWPRYLGRLFARREWKRGLVAYRELVSQIHADGYRVDSYQMSIIADEREVSSTLLQHLLGLVDVQVDREVFMLYTSFERPHGAGMLASYAPAAQAIGLGSTGGGVDVELGGPQPLSWDELVRDLRLAYYFCDDIHIFSLEGCAQQGFLDRLDGFIWDNPIMLPEMSLLHVESKRRSLQSLLWVCSHSVAILLVAAGGVLLWKGLARWIKRHSRSAG
jgi:hypothetical protein